jgi:hypothetical protein
LELFAGFVEGGSLSVDFDLSPCDDGPAHWSLLYAVSDGDALLYPIELSVADDLFGLA